MLLLSGVVVSGMMYGAWIPFIPPVIGLVVNAMVVTAWLSNREKQDRTLLMSLFSRHVSSEVAQAVWEKREQFLEKGRLRPQKVVVTTLFTDLEGFTTVAENMEPDTVLDWLNTYMERTVKIITNHGGMVDDYHGDMIKADFGVFRLEQTEANKRQDANNAVSCAVALEQEMRHLNTQWQQQGLPEVRMRIGMQTGSVVVGSLGSEQRLKFTTIGDSVNVASRLESFHKDSLETWSKDEVCRILIGETTKQYLGDHPWRLKEVGVITLRGKANRISVYRLFTNPGSPESRSVIPIEQARG
ncbi:MAG: adenylate/guanylate cyclase domain-containing protein, partial [Nitrospirales bacterium]